MNKQKRTNSKNPDTKNKKMICWQSSRALVSTTIPVELDLENREILLNDEALAVHQVQIDSRNLDSFISKHVPADESHSVKESLSDAGKGVEKPIHFCFVHPALDKELFFEYRYQITYVSYAKTRLKGELVRSRRAKKH